MDSSSRNKEIATLQYGRGIAALFVVMFHCEGLPEKYLGGPGVDNIFRAGHSGVEFFFLLSGFIIHHTRPRGTGKPHQLRDFYIKRAIRVLPMFWMVVIPMGLAMLVVPSLGADRELTVGKFLTDVFLIPRSGELTLPPVWTLQHELIFYLIAGLVVISRIGLAVVILWQAGCLFVLVFGLVPQDYLLPVNKLLGFHNLGFGIGMLIAAFYERVDVPSYRQVFVALGGGGLLALLVCFVGEWRHGDALFLSPAAAALTYFGIYSLIILGLLAIRNKPRPAWDLTLGSLGAASYALYLIHEPFASVLFRFLLLDPIRPFITPFIGYALSIVCLIPVALVAHYAIERPVVGYLRKRLTPHSSGSVTSTGYASEIQTPLAEQA
jgi:peptidoglycan/LPS O-acetylase OafA/YrhL